MLARIRCLFARRGGAKYTVSEPVTQAEHAAQTWRWMRRHGAGTDAMCVAALLHDIGHLTTYNSIDPGSGVDDHHEREGARWLREHGFPPAVHVPVNLHVTAKRYLAGLHPDRPLSKGSTLSLKLQGGPLLECDQRNFRKHEWFTQALLLREADDAGKALGGTVLNEDEWNVVAGQIRAVLKHSS
jgi:putative nucleotidyltransferase with HDIG domain